MTQGLNLKVAGYAASPYILWLYEIRKFMSVFTKACHCAVAKNILIQSPISHLISSTHTLILCSHQCLGLPGGFWTK